MKSAIPVNRRKLFTSLLILSAVLITAAVGMTLFFRSFMADLYEPEPVPPRDGRRQTVLCLGDSLTHGNVSANYVVLLEDLFSGDSVRFVNGGINGNMVHDVASRLDDLLDGVGSPDVVTLLIGTNDANATLDAKVAQRALEHPDVVRVPDSGSYRSGLENLVTGISSATGAEIILISIPTIGENPDRLEWDRSGEFASVCRAAASAADVRYVPFWEELSARLMADPPDTALLPSHEDWYSGMVKALISRHFFGKDYGSIGEKNGYRFHSDQLHLNEDGIDVLVSLLEPEIRQALYSEL